MKPFNADEMRKLRLARFAPPQQQPEGDDVVQAVPPEGDYIAQALPLEDEDVAQALPLEGEDVAQALPPGGEVVRPEQPGALQVVRAEQPACSEVVPAVAPTLIFNYFNLNGADQNGQVVLPPHVKKLLEQFSVPLPMSALSAPPATPSQAQVTEVSAFVDLTADDHEDTEPQHLAVAGPSKAPSPVAGPSRAPSPVAGPSRRSPSPDFAFLKDFSSDEDVLDYDDDEDFVPPAKLAKPSTGPLNNIATRAKELLERARRVVDAPAPAPRVNRLSLSHQRAAGSQRQDVAQPPAHIAQAVAQPPAHVAQAVAQPPAQVIPAVAQPPAQVIPAVAQPPAQVIPAVAQPPAQVIPAVAQPPAQVIPAVAQPPAQVIPAVVQPPLQVAPVAVQQPAAANNQVDDVEDPTPGICRICLVRPYQAMLGCHHFYCRICVEDLKAQKKPCAICRHKFRKWKPVFG